MELPIRLTHGLISYIFIQHKAFRPFKEKASVHFVGYSITGYLYLALLLIHGSRILHRGRCVLFHTCALAVDVDPRSVLVIDQKAFLTCREFYQRRYKKRASKEFIAWYEETAVG